MHGEKDMVVNGHDPNADCPIVKSVHCEKDAFVNNIHD